MIELREFIGLCSTNKCKTFLDYFQHLGDTQGYHLKADEVSNYLKENGKALVIFDGLDEIFDATDWENVNRMIAGFSLDFPKVQIIVTSRIVGYNPKILANADFSHFTLQEFEEKHIRIFLNGWYSLALYDNQTEANERKQRILKSLKDSSSIRQLAGNPLLLTILAIIGKHQELPRERWKLYDHASSVLVEHWEVNRHLKDVKLNVDFIGEEDKKELLRRIAFKMQSGPKGLAGNFIHRTELQKEIQAYIQERYKEKPASAKVIAESITDQLRKRNFILCLYGADYYGFIHRTFLEYFCASSIVEKFNDHEIDIEDLKNDFYGKYWEDRTWHEVLRLICGMKEKVVDDIIQYLMQIYHLQWYGERPPWNIVLAVKCLSEIRNPGAIDETAKNLLVRIFELFDMVRWTKDINQFLIDEIVPATKLIGQNWQHRHLVTGWISGTNYGYYKFHNFIDYPLSNAWAELAADLGSKEICQSIKKKLQGNDGLRLLAVLTLSKYQPKSKTIQSILTDLALKDNYYHVRSAAVQSLAQGWHDDPDTLPMLKDLAMNDKNDNVRSVAVQSLAKDWHDDPDTLPMLKDLAMNDKNEFSRLVAVKSLAQGWHDDPDTLPMLKDLAMNDKNVIAQ